MSKQPYDLRYLKLLAETFPNLSSASAEIVNLQTILSLPKGTEHFMSDVHGENEAFSHVMRNCSGVIRRTIGELFPSELSETEMNELATLIYYPRERMSLTLNRLGVQRHAWFTKNLKNILTILRQISSKYTRKKVRKAMPNDKAFLIEELLHSSVGKDPSTEHYFSAVMTAIVETGRAEDLIVALAEMCRQLAVDRLHIVGDIYDRGPGADVILDHLISVPSIDIQWGNHDVLWMGAGAGSEVAMACALRISLRYTNLRTIEDGYGISLLPLAMLALDVYKNDPCARFKAMKSTEREFSASDLLLYQKMQKAISVIQFKLEGQLIQRQPQFAMESRLMLHTLDKEKGTITIGGKTYPLLDKNFPTIDPAHPHQLTAAEAKCVADLKMQFRNSARLQKHIDFLFQHGSMYKVFNGTLMLHGCIPMTKSGEFAKYRFGGNNELCGKQFCDYLEHIARQSWHSVEGSHEQEYGLDMLYYLWTGPASPLFGKARMTTFERYFISDKETHKEPRDPYYSLRLQEETALKILREFGCSEQGCIINGHTPVKVSKGESPVKANGRLLVIDGGFSKAYQKETGIAGYTLIHNSYGYLLAEHVPFKGRQHAVEMGSTNTEAKTIVVRRADRRLHIRDTDLGVELGHRVEALKSLSQAFESGQIKERQIALFSRL
eukprot:PhF_6_TR37225/c0_g1_i1/m.54913/K04041/fbp3; fructose-1,6-bisphosphatase III